MLPTSSHSARISGVEVEQGFVGDGKVFIHVEKQADNSEKLMIYEAKNAFTGFFLNLFRDRKTTFTAREWAAKSQEKMPSDIDKERLIQNIKTAVSSSNIQKAREIFNKLVTTKKLDTSEAEAEVAEYLYKNPLYKPGPAATTPPSSQEPSNTAPKNGLDVPVTVESEFTRDTPLSKVACKSFIDASVRQLQSNLKSSNYGLILNNLKNYANDLGLKLTNNQIAALLTLLFLGADDSKFGDKPITQALLSHLDTGEVETSFTKEELQGFVELLIAMESTLKVTTPSPEQVRYLNTLRHIEENLNKQSNPAAVTNAS
jgi:hypothetical protein